MYYFKVAVSVLFIIELFASLAYTLFLSLTVAAQGIETKEAMRKSFIASFLTFMFMFIVYLMWQDVSKLDLRG